MLSRLVVTFGIAVYYAVAVDPSEEKKLMIRPKDTIPGYLGNYGIPVEEHWATTEDGYILKIFRMSRPGVPVLLLQHGILCSSWHWLINDPSIAPGIQLYKEGYDVWMTNSRGNTFSRNHTTLNPKHNKQFWNFTFAEMGRYDVPANIKYILDKTGKTTLTFVGWSQGTSQFFVSMTDAKVKAIVEKHVNLFVAIAPVSWMKHQKSGLLSILTDLHADQTWDTFFPYGFLNWENAPAESQLLCKLSAGFLCKVTVHAVCGTSKLDTVAAIENLTAHFPAGVSAKELVHYAQLIRKDNFRDYDYGPEGNMKQYEQNTPPAYDVSSIKVPTALFIGEKDDMGDFRDNRKLMSQIGGFNPALVYSKVFAGFSHITFFAGTGVAFHTWFPDLHRLVRKYNPIQTSLVI